MKIKSRVVRAARRNASRYLLDQLESRVMLNGNMTAAVSNGVLTLQGNSLNNSVLVDQASLTATQFRVSSGDGSTTINGQSGPLVFSGVNSLTINVNCGNDTVVVQNAAISNNLQITGAKGNQAVTLNFVKVLGNVTLVNSGGQNATTVENSTIYGNLTVNAGTGFNSTCGSFWCDSRFSNANEVLTLSGSTVFNNLAVTNVSGETSTDIESSTVGNNITVTNGAASYGNCSFNFGCKSGSTSCALAGDLFTLNASTVGTPVLDSSGDITGIAGGNVTISNASDGNTTTIDGSSTIAGNLAVSNVVGTSNQCGFGASCSQNLANASDAFTLSDFSSVGTFLSSGAVAGGNVTLANISDGASAVIDNYAFIAGGLTINNGVGSYGQGFTSCFGQTSANFGDFFTLSGGSFIGESISITNGSSYNDTDIEFSFVGGDVTVRNGLNLNSQSGSNSCGNNSCGNNCGNNSCGNNSCGGNSCGGGFNSVYTTDLFTLNVSYIGGNLAVTNASGYTNTTIEGNLIDGTSYIGGNATFINANGTALFTMNNTTVQNSLAFSAGTGTTTVYITQSTIGANATISVSAGASVVIDPGQVGGAETITL